MSIITSYATTDEEVVAIHHFLCQIAAPFLPVVINPEKSIHEVWRVVHQEVAIIAWRDDGQMLGTFGLTRMTHWWGDLSFFGNRWAFAIPGSRAWRPLMKEARGVARDLNMECHIVSEERGRVTILNKQRGRGHVSRK